MHLLFVGEHGECFPKFGMQLVGCVAHDGQATALSGAIAAERGHDDVATWLERTLNRFSQLGRPMTVAVA